MTRLEVAIAGCGVGGLASAIFLARAGHRVTVFDQFLTPAALGSGLILQPVGRAVLASLGLAEQIDALGAPIARLYGKSNQSIVLDVRYAALGESARKQGLGVHRAALFDLLFDAARAAGVEIAPGHVISEATFASGDRRKLTFANGREAGPFDLTIDALGVRSPLSRPGRMLAYGALWANTPWRDGFAADVLEQRYERARKMAGVLPIGARAPGAPREAAYFWSLRADAYEAWRAAPLDAWRAQAEALWPETARR